MQYYLATSIDNKKNCDKIADRIVVINRWEKK